MGRDPKSSPPGSATEASPHRASSAPSTSIEARILRTSSSGASGTGDSGTVITSEVPILRQDRANVVQNLAHEIDVEDAGYVLEPMFPRRQQRGNHVFENGILRSQNADLTAQRHATDHSNQTHGRDCMSAVGFGDVMA